MRDYSEVEWTILTTEDQQLETLLMVLIGWI